MKHQENDRFSLAELARETGLTLRTLRYYISRGLLPGPDKPGRGASYGREHLERLEEIRRLQDEGRTLGEIARLLAAAGGEAPTVEPQRWDEYAIGPDLRVLVRSDLPPWRIKRIRSAVARLRQEWESTSNE